MKKDQRQMFTESHRNIASQDKVMLDLLYGPNPITDDELRRLIEKRPHVYARYAKYLGKRSGRDASRGSKKLPQGYSVSWNPEGKSAVHWKVKQGSKTMAEGTATKAEVQAKMREYRKLTGRDRSRGHGSYSVRIYGSPKRFNGEYDGGRTAQEAARKAREMLSEIAKEGYSVGPRPYGESTIEARVVRYDRGGEKIVYSQIVKPHKRATREFNTPYLGSSGRDRGGEKKPRKSSCSTMTPSPTIKVLPIAFFPRKATSKAEENLRNEEATAEVRKAINTWLYSDRDPRRKHRAFRHRRNPHAPPQKMQQKISKKIKLLREEGYPEKQAIAIAYRMSGAPPLRDPEPSRDSSKARRARRHGSAPPKRHRPTARYFSVVIPRLPKGDPRENEWNGNLPPGWKNQSRGAFKSRTEAHAWAKSHLNGAPYRLREFETGSYRGATRHTPKRRAPSRDPGPRGRKKFTLGEAHELGERLGVHWNRSRFTVQEFLKGLNVELEHGKVHKKTDITHDSPTSTGKIALAHLNEMPDYYKRLRRMELRGEAAWRRKNK